MLTNSSARRSLAGTTASALFTTAALAVGSPSYAETVAIHRVSAPPRLVDFVDPDASTPDGMPQIDTLIQRRPVDGAPISERTAVYLAYDAKHLYAIFVCWYQAGALRSHLVNRDRLPDDDDSVAFHINTFHNQRHLYGFQVNPAGVQLDGVYTEGQGWDVSFDTVWEAETLIRSDRYLVMITVPFSSIRFPAADEHEWGVFVYRGIPRKNEEAFWPAYSTRFQGRVAYAGRLRGLERIDSSHATQVIPYGTFRALQQSSSPGSALERVVESRGGIDFKTIVHDGLVLDLTANPDFSQVESDEPQTTVNKRFEVYFPEKRPFFLENASYFDTPIQALFTRRIRDPRVGIRLSGKMGPYGIGALVADDVPATASEGSASASASRPMNSVIRLSRDLGADSAIGLIYSGHHEPATDNQVGGFDGRWRLTRNWVASAQALASASTPLDSTSQSGSAIKANIEGSNSRYGYRLTYNSISTDFRAASGFIPRTDMREITQLATLTLRPASRRIISWGPSLTLTRVWDHDGTVLDTVARAEGQFELAKSSHLSVFHTMNPERLRVQDAPVLPVATLFDQQMTGVTFGSAPSSGFTFSGEYSAGTAINLAPVSGQPPTLQESRAATLTTAVRPTPALTIDAAYLWSSLVERRARTPVFVDRIVRVRVNHQMTRRFSVRAIARYEGLAVDHRSSGLDARGDFNADLLVTYMVHPGTAIYIGLNGDRQHAIGARADQLFVKMSYLVRP